MTATQCKAEQIAFRLHDGQFDKQGIPYFEHLRAVVGNLVRRWPDVSQDEIDAAWLHDALEDTGADVDYLQWLGMSATTITIIELVTKPAGANYLDWIRGIVASGNRSAIKVKLADNEHNRCPSRRIVGSDIVERRYLPARAILEAALEYQVA